MIYFATVHYLTPKWIDLQRQYIQRFTSKPFKMFCYLTGIEEDHEKKFDFVIKGNIIEHFQKISILADKICKIAKDKDFIIFIDGDAFPITLRYFDVVCKNKLTAICRKEIGEERPHISFCVMRISLWKNLNSRWEYQSKGKKDLFYIIKKQKIEWLRLYRTNKINFHNLFFGIYGNIVYHHGAGFRPPTSIWDNMKTKSDLKKNKDMCEKIIKQNKKLSDEVFRRLINGEHPNQIFCKEKN